MNAAANAQQNFNPPSAGVQPQMIMSALSRRNEDRQIIHPTLVDDDHIKKVVTTTPNFEKYTTTITEPTTGKAGNNGTDLKPIGLPKAQTNCSIL